MNFNSAFNHQKSQPEVNSGEIRTEKQGYISAQTRIENLILAGQRLTQSRKDQYDFPDGKIDFEFNDPTRKKDFDLADAFQMHTITNERLKASQNVPKAPQTVSDIKTDVEPVKE